MTQISGAKLSGMRLDGAAFMSPNDLGAAVWLKRGTGITVVTGVSQWDDQSGNGRNFINGIGANQPSYNSGTGIITFDGVNDFLSNALSIPNASAGEIVAVVRFPVSNGQIETLWSCAASTAVDADAISWTRNGNDKHSFRKNVAGNSSIVSLDVLAINQWYIVSAFHTGVAQSKIRLTRDGIEESYINSISSAVTFSNIQLFTCLGAEARNSGGVPTTPINNGNFDIIDFAWFSGFALNLIQRSRLNAYYRGHYSDLLT